MLSDAEASAPSSTAAVRVKALYNAAGFLAAPLIGVYLVLVSDPELLRVLS